MSIGVEVNTRLAPASRGIPTLTDTLFVAGWVATGVAATPRPLRSIGDFELVHGARVTGNQVLYDGLDAFFREGGRVAYVSGYDADGSPQDFDEALALFSADFGPGQLAAWNETPGATAYGKLRTHALNNNRFALYDVALDADVAAMTTSGGATVDNDEYGMVAGQWLDIPAVAGSIGGSARQVPGSAVLAALIARSDALGNPNRAAAGRDFPLQYAEGITVPVTDAERATLLAAGVNTYADKYGVLQMYGFQTPLPQNADNPFWQANVSRARMWLKARAKAAGENYMFKTIDGRGRLTGRLKTDLDAICLELYGVDGLFGETPSDAFATEAGASVNTIDGIAQGELRGLVEARFSLHTKRVLIDLVSVPITGQVSQAV
jgi:hypothetical protein